MTLKYLLDRYNKIWKEEEIQKIWKHATINSKREENTRDVRSYRPVVLTNVLCKIFKRLSHKRLVWFFERERQIDDRQFGFRNQKRAIDAMKK